VNVPELKIEDPKKKPSLPKPMLGGGDPEIKLH